jgi:hypothetical protein
VKLESGLFLGGWKVSAREVISDANSIIEVGLALTQERQSLCK